MVTCCLLRVGAYAYAPLLGSFGINYKTINPITFPWRGHMMDFWQMLFATYFGCLLALLTIMAIESMFYDPDDGQ